MRTDYHMHFEYGDYDISWVNGFFETAKKCEVDEIGISEHSHGFIDFKDLYYDELILGDSLIGNYQKKWLLKKSKFRYSLKDYFDFMMMLKEKGYPVKIGIELCNFHNHEEVKKIISKYEFDYIIASIHFIKGWGFDFAEIKSVWDKYDLKDIYEEYTLEIEKLCAGGFADILGHPFNLRLFEYIPTFDISDYLERAAVALKKANMAIDVNTGTLYRYPIKEISPYPDFMKVAYSHGIPIIISSDAHKPEDCGKFLKEAEEYVQQFGYKNILVFDKRIRAVKPIKE